MTEPAQNIEVFYSYAHTDEQFRKSLITQLSNLTRQGLITEWHDRKIIAGTEWANEIDVHLNSANLILLLISPDFIASEYCYSIEMKRAMERYEAGEVHVIPIILRPTVLTGTPFEKLQALPTNGKSVTTWRNRDEAFVDIVQGIRKAIEEYSSSNTKKLNEIAVQYEEYCTKIDERWKMLDFKGVMHVEMNRSMSIPLMDVFIYPDVLTGAPEYETLEREDLPEGKEGRLKRRDADQFQDEERPRPDRNPRRKRSGVVQRESLRGVITKNSRLVILGDPGSGKSTLLRYLMLKLARKDETFSTMFPFADAATFIPLYITLAAYADFWRSSSSGDRTIKHFLPRHLNDNYLENYTGLVQHLLKEGRVVVLMDGLDEIPDASLRIQIVRQIEAFTQMYPGNRFIVTSRIVGYKEAPLAVDYQPHTLADFSEQQIKTFTQNWCPAYERWVRRTQGSLYSQDDAAKEAEKLSNATQSNIGVKRLAVNPLMLTILALIQRQGRDLPSHRIELFDLCARTLLETWVKARGRTTQLSKGELTKILRPLAFWMHSHPEVGAISEEDLTKRVVLQLRERGVTEDEAAKRAEQFLQTVRGETGILIERGKNRYGFLHLTFEEYFAASYLEQDEEQTSFIKEHLHDPRWREVILLTVGIVGIIQDNERAVTKLIQEAVLNADSPYEKWLHRDLLFAGLCLADDIGMNEGQANKIIEQITYLYLTSPFDALRESFSSLLNAWSTTRIGTKAVDLVLPFFRNSVASEDMSTLFSHLKSPKAFQEKIIAHYRHIIEKYIEGQTKLLYLLVDIILQTNIADWHYGAQEFIFHPDSDVRAATASVLGQVGSGQPEVVEGLLYLLEDSDSDVRAATVSALGQMGAGQPEVVERLLHLLEDSDSDVRAATVSALGQMGAGQPEVVERLLHLLEDSDIYWNVREATIIALGQIGAGQPEVVERLLHLLEDSDSGTRETAASALGQVGAGQPEVVERLLYLLEDSSWNVRVAAANVLRQVGAGQPEVVERLLYLLEDSDLGWNVREVITSVPEQVAEQPEVVEMLLYRLEDSDSDVRAAAASVLGQVGAGQPEVVGRLIQRLGDIDWNVRAVAASALGQVGAGQPEVVERLLYLLEDYDSDVRAAAANVLGQVGAGQPEVVERLLQRLGDIDWNVKVAAASALERIKRVFPKVGENLLSTTPTDLLKRDIRTYDRNSHETFLLRQLDFLKKLDVGQPEVVERLLYLLQSSNLAVRVTTASVLGQIGAGQPEVVESLLQRLGDSNWNVRVAAARALGQIGVGQPEVVEKLLYLLEDSGWNVRAAAASALGKVGAGQPEVVESLLQRLGDPGWNVRVATIIALGQIGAGQPEVVESLLQRLGDSNWNVRVAAARALGQIGVEQPEVVESLLQWLRDSNWKVRAVSASVLGQVGVEQLGIVGGLLYLLRDFDWNVREAAASALGQAGAGQPEVVESLLQWLEDPDEKVRAAAASALGQIGAGQPEAVEKLLQLLRDYNSDVRAAAASALGQVGAEQSQVVTALLQSLAESYTSTSRAAALALSVLEIDHSAASQFIEEVLIQPRHVADDLLKAHYVVNNLLFALQQIMGET